MDYAALSVLLERGEGHLKRTCPKLQTEAGTSSRNDDGEAAAVVQRAEVEEPPRPEPRPRRKRPEEPGTSAGAAEPGAAAPADADKEGVFAAVIKKRKLKKRTSAAADPAAGEEESVWGPIMVSHDSDVGSQPSAVVEPSAGSEGQEKGGPQPADLVSEDPVLEGSDVGGDSLGAQAGPVDVPPSDETPQPAAGSVAEMPAADGDSAGEEEDGSAGSDEDRTPTGVEPQPGPLADPEPGILADPELGLLADPEPGLRDDLEPYLLANPEPGPLAHPEPGPLANPEVQSMANPLVDMVVNPDNEHGAQYLPSEILSKIIELSLNLDMSMLGTFNRVSLFFRELSRPYHPNLYIREALAESLELDKENGCSISVMKLYKAAGHSSGLSTRIKELFGKDKRWMRAWILLSHIAFGQYKVKDIYWKM
ncbi:UNVERIFIED_CONTAM: hypothetical protein FKN15_071891 [Acipenser sinensis]